VARNAIGRTPPATDRLDYESGTRTGVPPRRTDTMSDAMVQTARELVAPEKGILAADESTGTITKRFSQIGADATEENRRRYRQLLFTTRGLGDHISGAILYDETIRQATDDGVPFTEVLRTAGVIPGIKVDLGTGPLAAYPGETVTDGLDGLRTRFAEYRELEARFAKWRATIHIDVEGGLPTEFAILASAHAMARYAALSQEADIVPIVEPEVLMDGDHDLEACAAATARTLQVLFAQLEAHRLSLPGSLLKVNMVVPGKGSQNQVSDETVAEATIACLLENVPADVPGVVFLSGGMSDQEATNRLNEMNRRGPFPWELSFSYGRALQQPSLRAWSGKPENVEAAQRALAHRARMNGLARVGKYSPELEASAA
jgi:fructose-bisphosphate aldolase, class I